MITTLIGNLNDEPMNAIAKCDALYDVDKMLSLSTKMVDATVPADYGRDHVIVAHNPNTQHVYFFPGIEAENRENKAARVKRGILAFKAKGFDLYIMIN